MEPIFGSSTCLICLEIIEKHISVPSDVPVKIFMNCNKYLHSTLTKWTLKDIELHNENQVPLCKSCFNSALELTQLSEQLKTIQKDISDLSEAFSMAVLNRRRQVYNYSIGQSGKTSSILEFNEACLPSDLFGKKIIGDKNIEPNKNNQEMDISDLHLQTDISNVKCEASDIQFDNLSGNPQQSVSNDDIEIQIKKENLDTQCGQSTIEQNQNLAPVSEMRILHVTGTNDSKKCAAPKNEIYRSNQKIGQIPTGKKTFYKCSYCEKGFPSPSKLILHERTHTGEKQFPCSFCSTRFSDTSSLTRHERTHTGEKPFQCSFCSTRFRDKSCLTRHKRIHTGEKSFKCSLCNNKFRQSFQLKRHERIHSGENSFKCSFCNNQYGRSYQLKRHERLHTGEKPYKCLYSKKTCRNGDKDSHREQMSSLISQSGTQKDDALVHLKHEEQINFTDAKKFQCSFCEMTFIQDEERANHENIHRREDEIVNENVILGI